MYEYLNWVLIRLIWIFVLRVQMRHFTVPKDILDTKCLDSTVSMDK